MSNAIVKNLNFGSDAKDNVFAGITKLTQAVSSTLGASGKCVILEDNTGNPIITCLLYTSPSPRDQRGSGIAACG